MYKFAGVIGQCLTLPYPWGHAWCKFFRR